MPIQTPNHRTQTWVLAVITVTLMVTVTAVTLTSSPTSVSVMFLVAWNVLCALLIAFMAVRTVPRVAHLAGALIATILGVLAMRILSDGSEAARFIPLAIAFIWIAFERAPTSGVE